MRAYFPILAIALTANPLTPAQSPGSNGLHRITGRISENAESFQKVAPRTLSEETLQQRSHNLAPGHPQRKLRAIPSSHREIVSVYGYGGFQNAPASLHEFRKIISVDGRENSSVEQARQSISLDLAALDDKRKKRLLEDFEKYALKGAVTDFGQLILLFSKRRINDYAFQIVKETRVGVEPVLVLSYRQKGGPESLTVHRDQGAGHQPLEGEIWVRRSDYLPLRITLDSVQRVKQDTIRDEAAVDYSQSPFGAVLPASVVHREYLNDSLVSENVFRYAPFRRISVTGGKALPDHPMPTDEPVLNTLAVDALPVVKAPVVQLPE